MKKFFGLLILIFSLIIACSNNDTVNEENGQSVTDTIEPTVTLLADTISEVENQREDPIIIQFAVDDFYVSSYDELIDVFEQEHPHVSIQVKSISDITVGLDPNAAMVRVAQTADVFNARTLFSANWQQLALDLTPFIEATPNLNKDDFPANLLQDPDGSIRVLPISLNPVLLAYNKALFAETDMAPIQPDWTWDEFRAAVNALTIEDNGETVQWGLVHAFPGSLSFYTPYINGWLIDWNEAPPRPRFDEPALIEAVQQHAELYQTDEVGPDGSTTTAYNEAERLIADGQAAMWPIFFTELARYAEMQDIGIITFPTDARPETTMVYVDGFSISAGSANSHAAWEWINFLSSQTPIEAENIPARTSIQEASRFWENIDVQKRDILNHALVNSFKYYFHPSNKIFINAVIKILHDDESVETALTEAQIAAEQMLLEGSGEEITTVEINETDTSSDEVITIVFIPSLISNTEPYRLATRQFEQENPGIQIEIKEASLGSIPNLDRGGKSGDCFQWPATLPYYQEGRESILSLDAFIQADKAFDLRDFYSPLVEPLIVQGELWGLPADITPLIIEYNKDLFDATGMPYPQPDWTMTDFLDMTIALTQGEGSSKVYGFVPEVSENLTISSMLDRYGLDLLDTSTNPATLNFMSPAAIEAVRWYIDLSQIYDVKPVFLIDRTQLPQVSIGAFFNERQRLIQDRLVVMWSRWSNDNFGLLQADTDGVSNLGAVPLPLNSDVQSATGFEMGYFIAVDTPHRQACWQWLTFLTTVDVSEGVPARILLAESIEYRSRVGEEIAMAQITTIEQMEHPDLFSAQTQWMAPYSVWFYRAVAQAIEKGVSVETALANAQDVFNAYRSCVIDHNAFQSRQAQIECAQEVDPSFPSDFIG